MSTSIAPKWHSKFEFKVGKWIYIPTTETLSLGREILKNLKSVWAPPKYYFHLKKGGHVAAAKIHVGRKYFLRLDIENFFGSMSRGRITRSLKPLLGYETAREYAHASTVRKAVGVGTMIPYGFPQSQILASICLCKSALGICLDNISKMDGLVISLYVDDILISSNNLQEIQYIHKLIEASASKARMELNKSKQQGPDIKINSFNIDISYSGVSVSNPRMEIFRSALLSASQEKIFGIYSYVNSVNSSQVNLLEQ